MSSSSRSDGAGRLAERFFESAFLVERFFPVAVRFGVFVALFLTGEVFFVDEPARFCVEPCE